MDLITEENLLEAFADWERWDLFAADTGRRFWTRSGYIEYRVKVDQNELYRGRSFEIAARVFSEPYGNYLIRASSCPNLDCEKPLVETLQYPVATLHGAPEITARSFSQRVTLRCWSCDQYAQIASWGNDQDIYTNTSGTNPTPHRST